MGYLSESELKKLSPKSLGKNVNIAEDAVLVGIENMSFGNDIRIDSNSVIVASNGFLNVGSNVHISVGCYLACSSGITLEDYVGLSAHVKVFTASDDFSGEALHNPTVPEAYKNIKRGSVIIGRHSIIGAGSTILPGVSIGPSTAVGAMSLVNKSIDSFGIYFGVPVKRHGERSKQHLLLEVDHKNSLEI
jgi:galactoside O-acetyltransferase